MKICLFPNIACRRANNFARKRSKFKNKRSEVHEFVRQTDRQKNRPIDQPIKQPTDRPTNRRQKGVRVHREATRTKICKERFFS